MNKNIIIQDLSHLNHKYSKIGFQFISLFGSYANDTADKYSDIDLTYKINHNLFYKDDAFAKLQKIEDIKNELEKQFHKKIDLIPSNSKNIFIQENLLKEQIFI